MNDIQAELNFLFVTVGWFMLLAVGLLACYWLYQAIERLLITQAFYKARRIQAQTEANLRRCELNMINAIGAQYGSHLNKNR